MFSGVGLFVFSDPGAAKAVLAQAYRLKSCLEKVVIISDRYYSFYDSFGLDIIIFNKSYEDYILSIKPDFIYTGTSYTSKIELQFIIFGKQFSIKTYSFVDHWTSIKDRFLLDNQFVYPENILLIDEEAKEIALSSGIDESLLIVFGNPYYDYLKLWRPIISKMQLFIDLNIPFNDNDVIVFAPDPLSNVNGRELYGFDEIEIMNSINLILDEIDLPINFILKLHPNQKVENIKNVISSKIIVADANVDSNLLIFYADAVWGFFSNFLIESRIMNKSIIRILSTNKINDPFTEKKIGKIVLIDQLKIYLEETYGK
jgi:hypothetical protein